MLDNTLAAYQLSEPAAKSKPSKSKPSKSK
jgi:hypothetical protein